MKFGRLRRCISGRTSTNSVAMIQGNGGCLWAPTNSATSAAGGQTQERNNSEATRGRVHGVHDLPAQGGDGSGGCHQPMGVSCVAETASPLAVMRLRPASLAQVARLAAREMETGRGSAQQHRRQCAKRFWDWRGRWGTDHPRPGGFVVVAAAAGGGAQRTICDGRREETNISRGRNAQSHANRHERRHTTVSYVM